MTTSATVTSHSDPFAGILGHGRVREALVNAVASGRVHHAWLFVGRDGIGKARIARRFAQMLMCEHSSPGGGPDAVAACGTCRHCRRVIGDGHPDAVHLAPEGRTIKIKQVRDLQSQVAYRPFEARTRVVFVHEAHALGEASANALLKTLEEPGDATVFVLLTDQPQVLLPTIVSRCQPVRFAPFPADEIAAFLTRKDLDHGAELDIEPEQAALVSVLAEGSLGRALELAGDDLDEQLEVLDDLDKLSVDDPGPVLELASVLAKAKDRLPTILTMLRAWYRDLLLLRSGVDPSRVGMRWRLETLQRQAASMSIERIEGCLDALTDIEAALAGNVNTTLAVERLLFRLLER